MWFFYLGLVLIVFRIFILQIVFVVLVMLMISCFFMVFSLFVKIMFVVFCLFVYVYWLFYDMLGYCYGVVSGEVFVVFEMIDVVFEQMFVWFLGIEMMFIVIVDYGFIDVLLEELFELFVFFVFELKFLLCGECCVVYCYVYYLGMFMEKVKIWLGECVDVMLSWQLVDEGWFGLGCLYLCFVECVGDVVFVMCGCYMVKDWIVGELCYLYIGNYGGMSEDEMCIFLIMEVI